MTEAKMCPILALGFSTRGGLGSIEAPSSTGPFQRLACVRERCQWWVKKVDLPSKLNEPCSGYCGLVPACA